jgi:hypothetical protein
VSAITYRLINDSNVKSTFIQSLEDLTKAAIMSEHNNGILVIFLLNHLPSTSPYQSSEYRDSIKSLIKPLSYKSLLYDDV